MPDATGGLENSRRAGTELLGNIKANLDDLTALQAQCDEHWGAEDAIYRFWHGSFKVYGLQELTQRIVDALTSLCPQGGQVNPWFTEIIAAGTGKTFEPAHNRAWLEHTRPIVDAYFHSRFMLDMVVKYGRELSVTPDFLPSGWAAVLTLYEIR
jgi:hypothetical protein